MEVPAGEVLRSAAMTTVRDLGYKPYVGKRLPASNNSMVLFRHGMRRAWGSWLVKTCVFVGWLPMVAFMVAAAAQLWFGNQTEGAAAFDDVEAARWVNRLIFVQIWAFVSMITFGAGAGAISEDISQKAFQFYFAKPITRIQYLMGRVGAVSMWSFLVTFVPAFMLAGILVGLVEDTARLATLGLLIPTLFQCLLIALVCGCVSVGVSSIGASRALTMSAWLLLFIVPQVVALVVEGIGDWPWMRLLSLPALLEVTGDAFFQVDRTDDLSWQHAIPVLVAAAGAGAAVAMQRLRRAEVIG